MFPKVSYISGSTDSAPSGSSNVNSFQNPKQMVDPGKTRVVVLTNHKTASASEFLAGVFQDLDMAVIMGSDTLGKGLGQRELGLPLGGGALKLSYHEFYTPSGRCVQRHQYKNNRNNVSMTQEKQSRQEAKLFYTANGRKLNNRRGIQMDYQVELPRKSLLSSLLSSSGAYFQFASVWSETHPWAPNSNTEFVMNDSIYNEFQSFVLREQKKGNLKLDEAFDDDQHLLNGIETLLSTGLQRPGVTKLREQIVEDLLKDFKTCRDISEEVERNILARYLPDSELVAKGLKSDALVQEAAKILDDQKTYDHLLGR